MSFRVLISGPLTTVQDGGREGFLKSGVGTSGVMDHMAYAKANMLVGNKGTEAVLEATLMGPSICFEDDTVFAICGADMEPKLDDIEVAMYTPIRAYAGQVLTLSIAVNGCRAYIAFAGGIDVPVVMNSRSTNLKCGFGGFYGRKLKNQDVLAVGATDLSKIDMTRKLKKDVYNSKVTLRAVPGPQEDYFTQKGIDTFYGTEYVVSGESDRMGFRLEGEPIENVNGVDIVSDGIAFGAVQVPSSGKPIVLLADRQTTGGYAKIATVCSFDIPKLVQLKPMDKVSFTRITVEEAQKIYKAGGSYGL